MEVCDVDVGVFVDGLSMKYGEGHRVSNDATEHVTDHVIG